jgi:SAM-dependent methyltransferase
MPSTPIDQELREYFAPMHQRNQTPVMRRIERAVCGCDYGATSWAMKEEIEAIAKTLNLQPAQQLLDLGAGSGWPGLFLAKLMGCDVTLVDLPPEGLAIAAARAKTEPLAGACYLAAASGAALPFADAGFDAINHSDVLCCLPDKRAVLQECRRVIRADGQMIFTILYLAPDQSGTELDQVNDNSPPYVTSETDYEDLLGQTGWELIERRNVSNGFLANAYKFLEVDRANAAELDKLLGPEEHAKRLDKDRQLIEIISNGHLCRDLYVLRPA